MEGQTMALFGKALPDKLKHTSQIEHTRYQSVVGLSVNLIAALVACPFFPKKPITIAADGVFSYENVLPN